jgi:uncharacterized protein YecT (DUF1311 family)
MVRYSALLVLAAGLAAGALLSPAFGPDWTAAPSRGRALAEEATTEKEAFEATKQLGTVEAWDAFLSSYPNGFYADLARAYVKKLGEQPAEPAPTQHQESDGDSDQPTWCSSPNNATERTICSDADLSSLDNVLNVAYRRAKHDSPNKLADIEYVQKHWLLGQRNLCGTDVACLRKRYNEQIQILESFYAD